MINIQDLGAIGDNVFDNTAIINQALIDHESVYIPAGTYKITAPLEIPDTRQVVGEGNWSVINYMGETLQPAIKLLHSPGGGRIARLAVISQNGMATNAILIDLASGKYVNKHIIEQCSLYGYNGSTVIKMTNLNQDGYFCSSIRNNFIINGGIRLERCGDSVLIHGNTITGTGDGVFLTFVQGAAQTVIRENSITAQGRSIYLGDYAVNTLIEANQIEHVSGSTPYAVMLFGTVGRLKNTSIIGNNINGHSTVTAAGIVVFGSDYTFMDRNQFSGVPTAVYTHTSADRIIYGAMNVYNGLTNYNTGTNVKTVMVG